MDYRDVASEMLRAVGGTGNVESVTTCLTRLRLSLLDSSAIDEEALRSQRGVLGVSNRASDTLEVVFGPSAIEGIGREFALLTGLPLNGTKRSCPVPIRGAVKRLEPTSQAADESDADAPETNTSDAALSLKPGQRIEIPAGRKRSYRAQQRAAIADERLEKDDIEALKAFLADDEEPTEHVTVSLGSPQKPSLGRSVLVINGPNINMLGTREPAIYGRQDYAALVALCKDSAKKAGFSDVRCFQSNHEGDLVDEIQNALGSFDGIVINPAAYTHTSVAILDAVKAVQLPCVEVHISKVDEREDFRQVSYIRQACFETVSGMGLEGYRKAIFDLAKHLGM